MILETLDAQCALHAKLAGAATGRGGAGGVGGGAGAAPFSLRRAPPTRRLCVLEANLLPVVGGVDKLDYLQTREAAEVYFKDTDRHEVAERMAVWERFRALGGRVVFFGADCIPRDDDDDDGAGISAAAAAAAAELPPAPQFLLRADDIVYPVCHEGQNRSQVMHLVLQGVMRQLGAPPEHVQAPHGASGGFDPFQAYEHLTEDNFFGYIQGHIQPISNTPADEWSHVAFLRVFGQPKTARLAARFAGISSTGEQGARAPARGGHGQPGDYSLKLNPEHRADAMEPHALEQIARNRRFMRTVWENTVYNSNTCAVARLRRYLADGSLPPDGDADTAIDAGADGDAKKMRALSGGGAVGRRVFVAFSRATGIIMQRLVEACGPLPTPTGNAGDEDAIFAAGHALADCVIVALPLSDPVVNAGCRENVDKRNAILEMDGKKPIASRDGLTREMYVAVVVGTTEGDRS